MGEVLRKALLAAAAAVVLVACTATFASAAAKPNKPAISIASPSEGATLTTNSVSVAFTYNRTPKQTKTLRCVLSGPTSTADACDPPTAIPSNSSQSGKSYEGLASGSYTFTVTLTLTDGGTASATRHFTVTSPFQPIEGKWFIAGAHQDNLYRRLTRTIDLTAVTAAQAPTLRAQLNYDTEPGYDNVILEAHTVGQDNWTTLPDNNGRTSTQVPTECEVGFLLNEHPFLLHYLTPGNPCQSTGTTGSWNSFTADSGGWVPVAFDLSAYAGQQVEVSIAYVSDPGFGGDGLFIDDTTVTTTGGTLDAEGFESGLGPWSIIGAPAGSPGNVSEFVRSQELF